MADQPHPGKIEALGVEIAELKAENRVLREGATRRDQEIAALREEVIQRDQEITELRAEGRSLYVHLSARDGTNAALARYVDELLAHAVELDKRERARADQAASVAVRDLAATAGLRGRDDGSLPQNVIDVLRTLGRSGVEVAVANNLPDLVDECRELERALDEGHPPIDTIVAAMMVVVRCGEADRDLLSRQAGPLGRRPDIEEWFEALRDEAGRTKGRGRPPTVPLSMIGPLVAEGLRGCDLARRICAELGNPHGDDSAAWRAIRRYVTYSSSGILCLFREGEDGQVEVLFLPRY